MKIQKIFQKTLFGIFLLFGLIGVSTSILCINTVDAHLSGEYETNSRGMAKTIADASVDIILNRDLSTLQSLIDQFVEMQGISYIYVTNESGEFLAHTFVPGIPKVILTEAKDEAVIERHLSGMGGFLEFSSPILAGVAGKVHIGMDKDLITLKVQQAIGQQVYLISTIFVVGILAAILLVNLAAKPLSSLLEYAVGLARDPNKNISSENPVLNRDDEIGHLARLYLHFASIIDPEKVKEAPSPETT